MCGERLTTDLFVSTADVLDMYAQCRERKAVFDNSSKPPTELRRRWHWLADKLFSPLHTVRGGYPQYVVTDPRRKQLILSVAA
ncbi:hypothetical protein TNCV_4323421 [Trichonephila clavipes]|nr:hypothetical protein TNCV_4323421 [Trichonephila clavipes]